MRILLSLTKADFEYDLYALVRSFFPDDELTLHAPGRGCEEDGRQDSGEDYDLRFEVAIPEYEDRTGAKNEIKRDFYRTLADYTGKELPWGVLSGIRPVRLPYEAMQKGAGPKEAAALLERDYLVSDRKADLAVRVASCERDLVRRYCGAGMTADGSYSLYVHIPFCPTICAYCSFTSQSEAAWKKQGDVYLEALSRDLEETADLMGNRKGPLSVYMGGGTPTVMSADQLDRLLTVLGGCFDLGSAAEFTVEAGRPDSITADKLEVLKKHGVGRISVNPQTMNEETLKRIGRRHTAEDVRRAFDLAREAGFDNINADIILGLPGEGPGEVQRTLAELAALCPESLTVHALAVKRASGIRGAIREDRRLNPDANHGDFRGLVFENSEELTDLVYGCAADMGMHPYYLYRQKNMRGNTENTGFALPGRECLYNVVMMEELQSVVSCGAGAISKRCFGDGRITRCDSVKDPRLYAEELDQMLARKRKLFQA